MANYNDQKILHNAEIIPVFYPRGGFDNRPGTPTLLRAPFKIVKIASKEGGPMAAYCMPDPIGRDPVHCWSADVVDRMVEMGREDFGYHTGKTIILGEHELGSYSAYPDNWRGFFTIGNI